MTVEEPFLRRLPVLSGVLPLQRQRIPGEIIAGMTLAALAIPEVMGYTKIAGMPVITGLYTMLVPAVLFALFCSSRHLVVGADSATAAILASGLTGLAAVGSADYLALAGLLALLVGLLLLAASAVGLGFMADFLSRTVLIGFLTGVGIQVALGAAAELLGLPAPHEALRLLWSGGEITLDFNGWALAMAAAVLSVMAASRLLSKLLGRNLPGAMIAVIGAIVASWAFDLSSRMALVGTIPVGLPAVFLPRLDWSFALIWQLLPTAFAMVVVVVLAQSAATARAYAARYDERLDETRDLTGLGLANIGAGLTGTFVVNGSPTKTEMVDSAGGRSQLALLTAAAIVLLSLLFLTGPLALLPQAALSAVVLLIGLKLIDARGMADIYRQRRPEFWVALLTAAVVVIVGVEQGIVFAILASLIVHTRHGYRPANFLIARDAGGSWQARVPASLVEARPGLIIYRFGHSMYYANADRMKAEILALMRRAVPAPRWLCIDLSAVDDVDYTAAAKLADLCKILKRKGVTLVFAQDIADIDTVTRRELSQRFPDVPFFDSLDDVAKRYDDGGPDTSTAR